MALDETILSAAILAEMTGNGLPVTDAIETKKLTDAIAKAVIDHFKAAAVVTVNGVTPGVGSAAGTIS